MERLTEHHYNKTMGAYMVCSRACIDDDFDCNNCKKLAEIVDRLAAYEDTGLEPEKVMDLAQAEKDGRLVVLPCKIGDAYFTVERFCDENGELPEFTLHGVSDCEWCCVPCNKQLGIIEHRFSSIKHILNLEDSIGKFVFLTRAEAEAALETKGEEDG